VPGPQLLRELCGPETTLVTGAPLKNLGGALRLPGFHLGEVVVQGGFAGAGVVPPEDQLEKFRGLATCPSFNLNGDVRSALAVIETGAIDRKRFVSKNVCHGVIYDHAMHERFAAARGRRRSIDLVHQGMTHYLGQRPEGKAFHDPLAAACAIDESIGEWAEVEIYRERGEWGARLSPGSGTRIIIGYDHERFVQMLLA
jgi:pyrimidine-specific ribonucleoside hydrolase